MRDSCQGPDRSQDPSEPFGEGGSAVPRLVVHPPDRRGWRRVHCDGRSLGTAYRYEDIAVFLAAAGMEGAQDVDLRDPGFVEWRGGGPEVWSASPME
ncbi:hypothetical protein ACFXEL_30190 [Streptomyces sp. NPDC059382]|uniref:hypothetical protein n=1 Tax=unclassified Streptomyces TaxID=2593676 RepID=UPI0033336A3A